jgi:hypothetical protein
MADHFLRKNPHLPFGAARVAQMATVNVKTAHTAVARCERRAVVRVCASGVNGAAANGAATMALAPIRRHHLRSGFSPKPVEPDSYWLERGLLTPNQQFNLNQR